MTPLPELWVRKDTSDRETFVTRDTIVVELDLRGEPYDFLVPGGYRFDLASVPRAFWAFVAPFELGYIAPLVHDRLYTHGNRARISRLEADRIFLDLMIREGIPPRRAKLAYRAVRIGGGMFW